MMWFLCQGFPIHNIFCCWLSSWQFWSTLYRSFIITIRHIFFLSKKSGLSHIRICISKSCVFLSCIKSSCISLSCISCSCNSFYCISSYIFPCPVFPSPVYMCLLFHSPMIPCPVISNPVFPKHCVIFPSHVFPRLLGSMHILRNQVLPWSPPPEMIT